MMSPVMRRRIRGNGVGVKVAGGGVSEGKTAIEV